MIRAIAMAVVVIGGESYGKSRTGQIRSASPLSFNRDFALFAGVILAVELELPLLLERELEAFARAQVAALERPVVRDDRVVAVVAVGPDDGLAGLDRQLGRGVFLVLDLDLLHARALLRRVRAEQQREQAEERDDRDGGGTAEHDNHLTHQTRAAPQRRADSPAATRFA